MTSCRDSSDGEGGDDSGTDDDADEDEEEKKKWVPEWAKGPLLKEALERVSDSPSSFSPLLSLVLPFSYSSSLFSMYEVHFCYIVTFIINDV